MKIYSKENVLVKTYKRIEYLFDEFDNIVIGFSGGKDSTTVLNISLEIATKRNRLPLKVMWLDQEAEWQGTVDYVEMVMSDKRIKPYWFQMPILMTNNASSYEKYVTTWKDGDEWIREKHPLSIKKNIYNQNRFHLLFEAIFKKEFPNQKSCYLAGVRAEEAPKRLMSLTTSLTYKDITWGKILNKKRHHYTFYPIYDWSYSDVWKYIHDNNLPYNKIYNEMYRHGVNVRDMRISNLHHETIEYQR